MRAFHTYTYSTTPMLTYSEIINKLSSHLKANARESSRARISSRQRTTARVLLFIFMNNRSRIILRLFDSRLQTRIFVIRISYVEWQPKMNVSFLMGAFFKAIRCNYFSRLHSATVRNWGKFFSFMQMLIFLAGARTIAENIVANRVLLSLKIPIL